MKKFTFKTLSILLAAVLLVAALPIAAFAEDDCCGSSPNGVHTFVAPGRYFAFIPLSQASHDVFCVDTTVCSWCGTEKDETFYLGEGAHNFGDEVDPEVDMCGTCVLCGDFIEW